MMTTVGKRYVGWNGHVYYCESHDPQLGFWMLNVDDPSDRRNVSERAIGNTYHPVRMPDGAWRHLDLFEKLGRAPTHEELRADHLLPDLTLKSLRQNGLIDAEGNLTDRGRTALGSQERGELALQLEF